MAAYFTICGSLTWAFSSSVLRTKENFLLDNRAFNTVRGMFSISSAWMWATALFVVPQLAYQFGFTGFFWVLGMNTLTLAIFGFAASKIRQLYPNGFTFAEHIKNNYGTAAHNTYIFAFLLIAILALSANIYAGGALIKTLTGLDINYAAAFLVFSAITFAIFRGLRGTNITEIFKMTVIILTALLVVPQIWAIAGWDAILKGMTGPKGNYGGLWNNADEIAVFMTIGIFFIFRHFSLPWTENSLWQRAFVIDPSKIKRTYAYAAALFFIAPAMFGTLGFVANGMSIDITNPQLTNVLVVSQLLGPWAVCLVTFMLLTGLTSLLDSQITSITTLLSHDVIPQFNKTLSESSIIDYSRIAVLLIVGFSWALINIPGVNIIYFTFVSGAVCMAFIVPTIVALFKPHLLEAKSLVAGILLALAFGVPVYSYAGLNKLNDIALIGFFSALIISTTVSLGGGYISRKKSNSKIQLPE